MTDIENIEFDDHSEPSQAVPPQEDVLTGTVTLESPPKLRTRTYVINVGPQTQEQMRQYLQNTVNAYELANFLILGHGIVDTGAGWAMVLTVGWYE